MANARRKHKGWTCTPKKLYEACKCWRDGEVEQFTEPATLAEIWSKATKEDKMGNAATFRKYVLHNYEVELLYA